MFETFVPQFEWKEKSLFESISPLIVKHFSNSDKIDLVYYLISWIIYADVILDMFTMSDIASDICF